MQSLYHVVRVSLLVLTFAATNQGPTSVAAASGVSAAQDGDAHTIQVTVNSVQRTDTCQGSKDSVQVTGSSDVLHITGSCGNLQVSGRGNIITIDSVQSVQLTGYGNKIFYRGSRPALQDHGFGNSFDKPKDK
jgi:hypothetical protein